MRKAIDRPRVRGPPHTHTGPCGQLSPYIQHENPFVEFDACNPTDSDIDVVSRFRKEAFNAEKLLKYAEDLVYLSTLKSTLRQRLQEQSTEFIELVSKSGELRNAPVPQCDIDRLGLQLDESIRAAAMDILHKCIQAFPKVASEVPPAQSIDG